MSMLGITAIWTCDICKVLGKTHHLEMAGRRICLDPPAGWRALPGGTVLCPEHSPPGKLEPVSTILERLAV